LFRVSSAANDFFVFLAAMQLGANAYVLNSDKFNDHHGRLLAVDEHGAQLFRRWIATRCVTLDWNRGRLKVSVVRVVDSALVFMLFVKKSRIRRRLLLPR
jgi:hypothetical protein